MQKAEENRQEEITRRRERLQRAQKRTDLASGNIAAGKLVRDELLIAGMTIRALNEQHKMWKTLHAVDPLSTPNLLKHFSKLKVADKRKRLSDLLSKNQNYDFVKSSRLLLN